MRINEIQLFHLSPLKQAKKKKKKEMKENMGGKDVLINENF